MQKFNTPGIVALYRSFSNQEEKTLQLIVDLCILPLDRMSCEYIREVILSTVILVKSTAVESIFSAEQFLNGVSSAPRSPQFQRRIPVIDPIHHHTIGAVLPVHTQRHHFENSLK